MPYIRKQNRDQLRASESPLQITSGELNYLITNLCNRFIRGMEIATGRPSYWTINMVIGALECAKLELYRRVAAPYEDQKCAENGDVYGSNQ